MLFLLLALQMSTTNCIPDYSGGMNCTTMTAPQLPQAVTQPPQLPPLPQAPPAPQTTRSSGAGWGLIGLIERLNDRKLRKKIGKMIVAGDCEGAAKLAFDNGWLELGMELRQTCTASETAKSSDRDFVRDQAALDSAIDAVEAHMKCEEALRLTQTGGSESPAQTERACER